MKIVTRKEAKASNLKRYFTGIECKRGHVSERVTSSSTCCECARLAHHYYDPTTQNSWYQNNRKWVRLRSRLWRQQNPRNVAQAAKQYYVSTKETRLSYNKEWRLSNKHKICSYSSLRHAQKLKATPAWVDLTKVEQIFLEAGRRTKETNIPHEVDHIIPLQSKTVCGLHWEGNLQILSAKQNRIKKNKYF